jgi:hypothetical protein
MRPQPKSLPEYLSTLSPAELVVAKSHLIKILRLNPWLSRFYADSLDLLSANSNQINNLQSQSAIFSNPDPKGSNSMSLNKNTRACTHIKVNGIRCGSPSLRGEVFCYFHQRMIRGVGTPAKSRLHPIALIENEAAIQASLMEVINALVRNTIDLPRAQLILRALNIAVRNAPRVHFQLSEEKMVREVPEYAQPEAPKAATPAIEAAEIADSIADSKETEPPSLAMPKIASRAASVDPTRRKLPARVVATPPRSRTAGRAGQARRPN